MVMLVWVQWLIMSADEAVVSEILLAYSSQPQGGCSSSRHHPHLAFRVRERGSIRQGFSFPSGQGKEYHSRRAFHLPGQALGRKCLDCPNTWRVAGREDGVSNRKPQYLTKSSIFRLHSLLF